MGDLWQNFLQLNYVKLYHRLEVSHFFTQFNYLFQILIFVLRRNHFVLSEKGDPFFLVHYKTIQKYSDKVSCSIN
ncbi:hypothetical protein BpHYR1_033589 [Brachionus plicatilis]|uniref:Uncharacterized protein n=1 Tax=Brachionus plicatilis TaxID=10195 RepID=A0A3M7RIZ6_BRAPC|nr:hypothetical protein BpHYR1_033589 [Brachionus plicatilis]